MLLYLAKSTTYTEIIINTHFFVLTNKKIKKLDHNNQITKTKINKTVTKIYNNYYLKDKQVKGFFICRLKNQKGHIFTNCPRKNKNYQQKKC